MYIARDEQGRAGSVNVENNVVVSADRHTPAELGKDPTAMYFSHCIVTGGPAWCDGTGMARDPYTNDGDMLKLAEGRIPA